MPGVRKDMEIPYLEADLLTPLARCSGGPTTLAEALGGDAKAAPTGEPRGMSARNLLRNKHIQTQKANAPEDPVNKCTYNKQTLLQNRIQNNNETALINIQKIH